MKRFKNPLVVAIAVAAVVFLLVAAQVTISLNAGNAVSAQSKTYAAGQVDTVTYTREAGLSGLAFAIYTKDSSNITSVVVRRSWNGVLVPAIAGDTLVTTDSSASARSILKTVTLAPLPEAFSFVVTFASNNGALDNGTTTPTVKYGVVRQYSRVNNP